MSRHWQPKQPRQQDEPQLRFRNHAVDYIVTNKRAKISYTDTDRIAFKRFLAAGRHDQYTLDRLKVLGCDDASLRDLVANQMHPPVNVDAFSATQWTALANRIVNAMKYRLEDLVKNGVLVQYYSPEKERYTIRWTQEIVSQWTEPTWQGQVDAHDADEDGNQDGERQGGGNQDRDGYVLGGSGHGSWQGSQEGGQASAEDTPMVDVPAVSPVGPLDSPTIPTEHVLANIQK